MKQTTCTLVGLLITFQSCWSSDPFGINSEWPAGGAARGAIVTSPRGVNYTLLGVGFCRGGPPGGSIATAMVSYVGIDGSASPDNSACFDICDQLKRCTGAEVRISDQWCELQIPSLTLVSGSDRNDRSGLDWDTGADAAAEASLTAGWNRFNAVAGSPSALTTSKAQSGFGCWGKMMTCTGAPRAACDSANRYPCEESYVDNSCGPCAPLFIPSDGSNARLPASSSSSCIPDPSAILPTLKISLGSPWYGGEGHEEALFLAMIYGIKKAWVDKHPLIPIALSSRMAFPVNITGHTDEWGYTLTGSELAAMSLPAAWDTRVENHPMAGLRAMAAFKQDAWSTQYGLMEPADADRTRPHCVLGSSSTNSLSGLLPHSNPDLALSHAATFYETPVLGWAFQSKEFSDRTLHGYYFRVNRVGLTYFNAVASLIREYGYTRVGVVTSGVSRAFVRGLQEKLDAQTNKPSVELFVEDMNLAGACNEVVFEAACHKKVISSMQHLRDQDVRIVVHEQDGLTHLDAYWTSQTGLLRNDTLYIQVNTMGDCQKPLLPPTTGEYGVETLWENMRKASTANNQGEWAKMLGQDCRVCPNWAFRYGSKSSLSNKTFVAHFNVDHMELIYDWSNWCPQMPTVEAIMQCTWCDPEADFWIAPACADELNNMRTQFQGSLCVGTTREDDMTTVDAWIAYLGSLTSDDLIAVGAPRSFFDIFNTSSAYFQKTGITLSNKWGGSWPVLLREKASLMDALLLALVSFNTWVKAAGDSSPGLDSTALRTGFRTTENAAIPNWKATIRASTFSGLTGPLEFNEGGERRVGYTIYQARGPNLMFTEVGKYDAALDTTGFSATMIFNDGGSTPPPDREPPCAVGYYYSMRFRGCQPCQPGNYCRGGSFPMIPCDPGYFSLPLAGRCEACAAGEYAEIQVMANNQSQPKCLNCSVGKYQNRAGQSECFSCRSGTFSDGSGQTTCARCPRGEFASQIGMSVCDKCANGFTTENIASEDSSKCVCPEGTFQDVGGLSCTECREGMTCPIGSNVANFGSDPPRPSPLLDPGFWTDPAGDMLSVFECEDVVKCPGGPPGACASLLEGRSCTRCMTKYEWNGETCLACSNVETSKFLYPVLPLMIVPIILGCMYKLFSDSIPQWGSYGNGVATVTYLTLNHYQVIDLISKATTRQNVPAIMQDSLEFWSWTNEVASMLSAPCAGFSGFSAALVGQALLPVMLLLIALSMYLISEGVAATAGQPRLALEKNRLFNVFMSLIFTFFTAIAALSLALFKCLDNPNGKKTLAADVSMVCFADEWSAMLVVAVFAIAVYVVGFAALLLWVIIIAKANIGQPHFQMRWKFLFIKFRFDAWWFAMTYLAKGLLYNLGFVVFTRSLEQLIWLMLITTIYLSAVLVFLPYRHRLTTIVDAMVCVSIIYCSALKTWFSPRVNGDMDHAVAVTLALCSFLPIIVSCAIGLYMAYLNKIGKSRDGRKVQKQCDDFCLSVITLADSDPSILQSVFKEVSEIDRWHMTQTTSLFNGKRNLGMVGNKSGQSLGLGQSKSLDRFSQSRSLSDKVAVHEQTVQTDAVYDQPVDATCKFEEVSPAPPAVDHEHMHLFIKEAGRKTPPLQVTSPRRPTTPRENNGPRTPR